MNNYFMLNNKKTFEFEEVFCLKFVLLRRRFFEKALNLGQ